MTFALGGGAAMAMPAQQATIPELVPRTMLGPAVAYFLDASWLEHLRQRERVTESEHVLQEQILALLADPDRRPQVRHYVGGAPGAPLQQPDAFSGKEMV